MGDSAVLDAGFTDLFVFYLLTPLVVSFSLVKIVQGTFHGGIVQGIKKNVVKDLQYFIYLIAALKILTLVTECIDLNFFMKLSSQDQSPSKKAVLTHCQSTAVVKATSFYLSVLFTMFYAILYRKKIENALGGSKKLLIM